MAGPGKVFGYLDSQIWVVFNFSEGSIVHLVCELEGFAFVCNAHGVTFRFVETHFPTSFPRQ